MFTRIFNPTFICMVATTGYAMSFFAETFWVFELVTHFTLHALVATILFALVYLYQTRYLHALWLAVVSALFFTTALASLSPIQQETTEELGTLKILQFNVYYGNKELPKAIPWIIAQNADIVVLQEINHARSAELGELKKHYTWWKIMLNENRDAFGMAIFSNKPVSGFDYVSTGEGWNHYTLTKLLINNQPLHIYEIHTFPPVSPYFAENRNSDLKLIAEVIAKDETKHKILIGDLNCTVFSPYFIKLEKASNLHHAQRDFSVEGTWPNFLPAFLRLGIDHLLASEDIKIIKRSVEDYHGSDHMPVVTELVLYD